jgi:EAL domain-containing protein (putative c-di-GMP-specific phosphodiesterase class I)
MIIGKKIYLVLEGIEQEIDLTQAKLLNVPVAQGYLLGEPQKL